MFCSKCSLRPNEYNVLIGGKKLKVCAECYEGIFLSSSGRGIEFFTRFLLQNYNLSGAKRILASYVGEGVYTQEQVDTEFSKMFVPMSMFTYGILKYPANIENEGGSNIVENSTVTGHEMYLYNNSFPVTKHVGGKRSKVYGTYFEVPAHVVLLSYDIVESYNPDGQPENNMYNRQIVDVKLPSGEVKQANMYIANQDWFSSQMIPANRIYSGNFDDAHLAGVRQ